MRNIQKQEIINLVVDSRKILLLTFFLFVVGVSCGIFLEICISQGEKEALQGFLSQYLFPLSKNTYYPNPFPIATLSYFIEFVILTLMGLTILGIPAGILIIMSKGIVIGFSCSILVSSFGLKGIVYILLTILPQSLFIIPAYLIACSLAFIIHKKKSSYILLNSLLFLMVFVGCAIEGLVFAILL